MFLFAGDVAVLNLGLSQTPFVSSAVDTWGGRSVSLDFARDERVDLKSSPERVRWPERPEESNPLKQAKGLKMERSRPLRHPTGATAWLWELAPSIPSPRSFRGGFRVTPLDRNSFVKVT